MFPGTLFDDVSPHVRVATAIAPFAGAMILRVALGRNGFTRWMVTLSTMWFAINILMAPYSAGMRQDIQSLTSMFR